MAPAYGICRRMPVPPLLLVILALLEHGEAQGYLSNRNKNTDNNEDNDDPSDGAHLGVSDRVGQNLGKVEEDTAAFVQDLDAGVYLEVFADGGIERVECRFRVPEEVRNIENIGSWKLSVSMRCVSFA